MSLTQAEKDMAAALNFDEAIFVCVKEHTLGRLSQEMVSYVDPSDPYQESTVSLLLTVLPVNGQTEQHDLLVERLLPLLRPQGYLPFLIEQPGDSTSLAILKTRDKMDIPIVMGTVGAGMNYDITDDDILGVLRDWNARFGIEFLADSGGFLRLKFANLPDDLDAFLLEVNDFCPTLLELAAEDDLEEPMAEFQRTNKISFWWD